MKYTTITEDNLVMEVSNIVSDKLSKLSFFQRRNNSLIQFVSTALMVVSMAAPAAVGLHWGVAIAFGVSIVVLSTLAQAFTKGNLTPSASNDLLADLARRQAVSRSLDTAQAKPPAEIKEEAEELSPFAEYYNHK